VSPSENSEPLGPPGPRDHLVTRRLRALLKAAGSDFIPALEELDGAEGPARLARHIAETSRRELEGLGDDQAAAEAQAELVNALLSGTSEQERLVLPPQVLAYVEKRRPGLDTTLPRAPLPATPFSISDLLVNAEGQPNTSCGSGRRSTRVSWFRSNTSASQTALISPR
jgi:hypothetical protein